MSDGDGVASSGAGACAAADACAAAEASATAWTGTGISGVTSAITVKVAKRTRSMKRDATRPRTGGLPTRAYSHLFEQGVVLAAFGSATGPPAQLDDDDVDERDDGPGDQQPTRHGPARPEQQHRQDGADDKAERGQHEPQVQRTVRLVGGPAPARRLRADGHGQRVPV